MKWTFLTILVAIVTILTGCEPLTVLDPKGPQAKTTADVIMLSIWTMLFIVIVVFVLLAFMLTKYRASKQSEDYEPPFIKGSKVVESICIGVPILIVIFLSIVTVNSTYKVEAVPEKHQDKEPLVIYAASSNWKWHFSYPEQNIETVNHLFIPTNRPVEFRLYAYGPISSFWVPQLAGQKYAMANMLNTLHVVATVPGDYMGRNASFTGEGFAEQSFNVKAMPQNEFEKWVEEIKSTAEPLTEKKFNELLEPGHLGQLTFTGTHLTFSPPPTGHHGSKHPDEQSGEGHQEHQHSSDQPEDHHENDHADGHSHE
jgi:cytochrome aa3-600 menaquinol oxidase subunit 2